jgi:hypothetical protein
MATSYNVVRSSRREASRDRAYDPEPRRIEPAQVARLFSKGKRTTKHAEAERLAAVVALGRAFDCALARGDCAGMLSVAAEAEAAGYAGLARQYRAAAERGVSVPSARMVFMSVRGER